jgi:hypothetical protein
MVLKSELYKRGFLLFFCNDKNVHQLNSTQLKSKAIIIHSLEATPLYDERTGSFSQDFKYISEDYFAITFT